MPDPIKRLWVPGANDTPEGRQAMVEQALRMGRTGVADDPSIAEGRRASREASHSKRGVMPKGGIADLRFVTGRPTDLMFYWRERNLPYDVFAQDYEGRYRELERLRVICRLLYGTHPVLGPVIDVLSTWPLTGMELEHSDSGLSKFGNELFIDDLDYDSYLSEILVDYFSVGEALPLGTWSELLGVWTHDELMEPNDVEVIRSPLLAETRFEMRLPKVVRDILRNRRPLPEYEALVENYPELAHFSSDDDRIEISNIKMRHLPHRMFSAHPRGIPILLRAIRTVVAEEMLHAAQDGVAHRLYTPLILAKLGASATDLGTTEPWIPTEGDLWEFEEAVDAALAGDFRMLVYHFALEMDHVLGREVMPRLKDDFDYLTDKMLQVFGMSRTLLSGAERGQTYAADALNRDVLSAKLTQAQNLVKSFWRDRMEVVAEAQEHYEYEQKGSERIKVMEEVLEVDPETGEEVIVERPKLAVPEPHFLAMDLRQDEKFRQFVEALDAAGVPISMRTRMVNVPFELDDEIETSRREQVQLAVEAQRTRLETYRALRREGLPIPDKLKRDFEPTVEDEGGGGGFPADEDQSLVDPNEEAAPNSALTGPDLSDAQRTPGRGEAGGEARDDNVVRLPRSHRDRPEESDEQRDRMPRPAVRVATEKLTYERPADGDDEDEDVSRRVTRVVASGSLARSPLSDPEVDDEPSGVVFDDDRPGAVDAGR